MCYTWFISAANMGNAVLLVRAFIVCGFAALVPPAVVQAQIYDPAAIVAALAPDRAGPTVRALSSQNALNIQYDRPLPAAFDFASIDIPVAFDGDSHILTAAGMKTLRTVAVALNDPALAGQKFQVAGHVFLQSAGPRQLPLSTRRAQAVVEHLVVFYGVPRDMLIPVGYGATKPRNPSVPYSPENTRMELINLSGG